MYASSIKRPCSALAGALSQPFLATKNAVASATENVTAFAFEGAGTELVASLAGAAALAAWLMSSTGMADRAGAISAALGGGRPALSGIGKSIALAAELMETARLYAWIAYVVTVSVTLNLLALAAEQRGDEE